MSNLKLGNMLRPQVPSRQSSSPSLSRPMPPIPPFGGGSGSAAGGTALLLSPQKSTVQLRDLTPTSSAVHRSGTPTGIGRPASVPRSSSASKVTKLAQATFEAQSANASLKRHPSRRRVRRWENANLLLGEAGLSLSMAQLELEDEEGGEGRSYGIVVDMPSCFRKLFLDENVLALEAFRACAESQLPAKSGLSQHQASLSVSPRAWMQVERRLRQVVRRVILSQPETHAYCRGLEMLLVCLAHSGALPEPEMMPEALRSLLVARPSVDNFGASEGEGEGGVLGRELTLHLADSSFHRLLLHAVCQFYGLKSKSTSEGKPRSRAKSRGGTKAGSSSSSSKATKVVFGRRLSASLEARASMVGFLLLGLGDEEEAVAELGIE